MGWPIMGWPLGGLEPEADGAADIFSLDSKDVLQAGDQSGLRTSVDGGDENGVVAGDGSGDFRPGGTVDRDRDTLRGADGGPKHGKRRAGTLDPSDELREAAEITLGASDLIRRQYVASTRLEHAQIAQIPADGGLRHLVPLALEHVHQVFLLAHQAIAQYAHDGVAADDLLGIGQHNGTRMSINLHVLCILMQKRSRGRG